MLRISMIWFLLFSATALADIYRSQDEFGHTVFTDRPSEDAEAVELATSSYRYKAEVKRVIDGDTLLLKGGEKVRLIGINTPKIDSRFSHAQPGGAEAKSWLEKSLRHPYVWLQYDTQAFDKYERRLAHVYLESGQYLNALLLEQGLAMLTLTPPNLAHADKLILAQQLAEEQNRGIWAMADYRLKTFEQFSAGNIYSGWQRWQLTPTRLYETQKYVNLQVSESLLISIPKAQKDLFPVLEDYLNKSVEVRGWLRKQGSQQRLFVQHPSMLIPLH